MIYREFCKNLVDTTCLRSRCVMAAAASAKTNKPLLLSERTEGAQEGEGFGVRNVTTFLRC